MCEISQSMDDSSASHSALLVEVQTKCNKARRFNWTENGCANNTSRHGTLPAYYGVVVVADSSSAVSVRLPCHFSALGLPHTA